MITNEEISKVCEYIRSHKPQKTEFETIAVAIMMVMGDCRAATRADMVNPDDVWLIPEKERDIFAGIKGVGWSEKLAPNAIKRLIEAARYAMKEYIMGDNLTIEKLMRLRDELNRKKKQNEFIDNYNKFDSYGEEDFGTIYKK